MANLAPIAIAALGAGLDAALDAAGVDGKHVFAAPPLLVLKVRITVNTADLRLYCYDPELGYWVPSAVAVATYAVGLHELRFNTAAVSGYYALVQEAGTGVVEYVFRPGRN